MSSKLNSLLGELAVCLRLMYANTMYIRKGIKIPIISAPMAGASGGALAAAVTLSGGFGFLAAGE